MPKCYSEREKKYIVERLKEEAAKCMAQYGIRRTTVDELVKRVSIPKGTFYLFYQSKEMLLFEVILELHDKIEHELYQTISNMSFTAAAIEELTEIILVFYQKASDMPILNMINSDEVELLARKLPPEVVAEHWGHDNSMIERVFASLPIKPNLNPEALNAAFRAIYFSTLHKHEIGTEHYDKGLRLLIHGLLMQIL